ncbi:MAG: S8 family serine peptidase, partial [Pseudomonadota bacterium]
MKLKLAIATALLTTALVSGPTANQDVQPAMVNSTLDAVSFGIESMAAPQLASSIELETTATRDIVEVSLTGRASAVVAEDSARASRVGDERIDVDAVRMNAEARAIAAAKMPPHLFSIAEAGGDANVELVVRHSGASSLTDAQLDAMDAEVVREFHSMDMRAVRIPADALMAYALDNQIDWISPDEKVYALSKSSHGSAGEPTVGQANYAFTGRGVGIAVVDSGVLGHADLPAGILQFDFRDPASMYVDPNTQKAVPNLTGRTDGFGHGTHISGTILGTGVDSGQ